MKLRTLKVDDADWESWKRQAAEAQMSVSGWIRERCNQNGGTVRTAAVLPVVKRGADAVELDAVATGGSKISLERPKGKTCKHGTAKGWNCWQCGGLAVIE